MKWTGLNELRESFLTFFESKDHLRLASAPLLPQGDNSLLLINSGMAPLKKYFSGEAVPPSKRATSCQKCIRTPDIERVGITARHGTYFEMLGNFSFGDYFKRESLEWSWEFCTKVLELPADRLWATVYENDDEAYDIWTKEIGMPASHVVRLGKDDNFWEIGSGPCGPCSEIYFDRGPQFGCGSPECKPGCDCDRYMEFWNNVFTQYNHDGNGNYTELVKKNIDTGMGLERLACLMQGVDGLFEVDTVRNILNHVCRISGATYKKDEKADISIRVVTDHIRSTVFMTCDGILPSNEGRGYVLRRLLRRASRHGRLLGVTRPFLTELCDTVIEENKTAYPELLDKAEYIKRVITEEEKRFAQTIDSGMTMLGDMIEKLLASGGTVLSADDAFKLYDTYGFPIDLTREIAEEKGLKLDMERFTALMEIQKETARSARSASGTEGWNNSELLAGIPVTRFAGYDTLSASAQILAIIADAENIGSISTGREAILVLDSSPFYAESGGQVGDVGLIRQSNGVFEVMDTKKTAGGLFTHIGKVIEGNITVGPVTAEVNESVRNATMRNHSTAHLLQAALRKVLGGHVHQAGSYVSPDRLRFDFSHFSAMTPQEITAVEEDVNQAILSGLTITTTEMPIAEAKKLGAMALFGEKYGDRVRVVKMGDVSTELCGGTHLDNTAKAGLFKIISESSVAAGVRRIEAVTGLGVFSLLVQEQNTLHQTAAVFKLKDTAELIAKVEQTVSEIKSKDKTIEDLENKLAALRTKELLTSPEDVDGLHFYTAIIDELSSAALKQLCEDYTARDNKTVILLASPNEGQGLFACGCGSEAVARGAKAGNIIREVAKITGGNGGGRPEFAMAGAKDNNKIPDAVKQASEILKSSIK